MNPLVTFLGSKRGMHPKYKVLGTRENRKPEDLVVAWLCSFVKNCDGAAYQWNVHTANTT